MVRGPATHQLDRHVQNLTPPPHNTRNHHPEHTACSRRITILRKSYPVRGSRVIVSGGVGLGGAGCTQALQGADNPSSASRRSSCAAVRLREYPDGGPGGSARSCRGQPRSARCCREGEEKEVMTVKVMLSAHFRCSWDEAEKISPRLNAFTSDANTSCTRFLGVHTCQPALQAECSSVSTQYVL